MAAKVIRTEEQHQAYLEEVHLLMADKPLPGSADAERLELLSVLIESYENQRFPIEALDPIDAIQFRMAEQGLRQADLVPYFGTRSRVSEVLSRKRPLTVNMIRALSSGLGISAETLIGTSGGELVSADKNGVDWARFPIKEMVARGWIQKIASQSVKSTEELLKDFVSSVGLGASQAAFKRTLGGEAYSPGTKHSLFAWMARVVHRTREKKKYLGRFDSEVISAQFMRELAQLSWFDKGPVLAVEFLEKHGIAVVIEPHLRGTLLDGAAMRDDDGTPIIALTLRFDRLDNFWFTVLHEVAHLWKHLDGDCAFLDNLDASTEDRREIEANRLTKEALIPRVAWKRSEASINPSRGNIDELSRELKIHPAIIAGRIRRDRQDFTVFSDLVGQGQVRQHFSIAEEGV